MSRTSGPPKRVICTARMWARLERGQEVLARQLVGMDSLGNRTGTLQRHSRGAAEGESGRIQLVAHGSARDRRPWQTVAPRLGTRHVPLPAPAPSRASRARRLEMNQLLRLFEIRSPSPNSGRTRSAAPLMPCSRSLLTPNDLGLSVYPPSNPFRPSISQRLAGRNRTVVEVG